MEAGDVLFGRRIRQNHALEHGTVTILTRKRPDLAVSARSTSRGFTVFAGLDPVLVEVCCKEALARLQSGEAHLALHRNCGTNLAVGTSVAMAGSLFGFTALRMRTRVVSTVVSAVAGMLAARPIGMLVQRHITTLPDLSDVRIVSVRSKRLWGRRVVEVLTSGGL